MKLKNKKTGEICDFKIIADYDDCTSGWRLEKHNGTVLFYDHIDEIHEEWEGVPEEPKECWFVSEFGKVYSLKNIPMDKERIGWLKQIGNYFSSREEAEKAVEKLKAWKRLKDRNLRFDLNYSTGGATINHKDVIMCRIEAYFDDKWEEENMKTEEDLDLLLGGEE